MLFSAAFDRITACHSLDEGVGQGASALMFGPEGSGGRVKLAFFASGLLDLWLVFDGLVKAAKARGRSLGRRQLALELDLAHLTHGVLALGIGCRQRCHDSLRSSSLQVLDLVGLVLGDACLLIFAALLKLVLKDVYLEGIR